jgi:methylphosphotriester-DNA--protein-cysteine methyltransferase
MVSRDDENRGELNCEHVWREISNYVDGEVDAELRAAMDDHFRTCKQCASVLEGMRNVVQLYGDDRLIEESIIEVPAKFGRILERRLAQATRVRSRGWSTWSAWLVPVAALLLITGGIRVANSLSVAHPLQSEHAQPGHGIPPDMLVVVTAGAKDFHVPTCGVIHNKSTERTITAKEAIDQGYVPCVRCMRKYLETAQLQPASLEFVADAYLDAEEDAAHRGR